MTDIIPIKNPLAAQLPDLKALFADAFETVRVEAALPRFLESIGQPDHEILALRHNGEWKGLAWLQHPAGEDGGTTTVLHFYSKGGVKCREALIKGVVEAAKTFGSTKLVAWDMHKKPKGFARIFRSAGPVKEVIRAYEFDLSEARY